MVSGLGAETESDTETPPAGDLGPGRKLKLDLDTRVRDQVRRLIIQIWGKSVQLSVTS